MSTDKGTPDFRLNDSAAMAWARAAALIIVLGIGAISAWMVLTPIDEVTKARGEVRPLDRVRTVETLYGGRLKSVLVTLGQTVEEGALLAIFDRAEAVSELEVVEAKIVALDMEIERLTAFIEGTEPDFSAHEAKYPRLAQYERDALRAQRSFVTSEEAVIQAQISEKKAELQVLEHELPELAEQLRLVGKEREIQESLRERQLVVRERLASLREEEARLRLEQAKTVGRQSVIAAEISELESSINRIRLEETTRSASQVVESRSARLAEAARADALRRRVAETEIRAPVRGIVQDIPDDKTGDVLQPGDLVASVVPSLGGLLFRGAIAPRDIAFVEVGQPVRLKFDSFDFSRYGALTGNVKEISPTTQLDQRGNAFYRVEISLDQTFFREAGSGLELLPGMTGEADIRTGEKTVFEYVWKPIYSNLDLALSER